MKKSQLKPRKKTKDEPSKKQDEPLMGLDELVQRIVRVKSNEIKAKKN
jgi:hypothetical protein